MQTIVFRTKGAKYCPNRGVYLSGERKWCDILKCILFNVDGLYCIKKSIILSQIIQAI